MAAAAFVEALQAGTTPERDIVALIDRQPPTAEGRACLVDLLHEGHPIYDQRGAAGIVRLRGWILLAFLRTGLSDAALACVLEELETGCEPYLVAAAARVLRTHASPSPALAPFVLGAIGNIRSDDVPVSLDEYGDGDGDGDCDGNTASTVTSPLRELLATLVWLGPHAAAAVGEIAALKKRGSGLPRKLWPQVDRALDAARRGDATGSKAGDACCAAASTALRWPWGDRRDCSSLAGFELEDQDGVRATFAGLMQGHATIVAFFYTRCDNPRKCSLTIAKLAALQLEIEARGLGERIHIAAISYDGAFDAPGRMRAYARDRGLRPSTSVRLLRATTSLDALRRQFGLGVGFIESLVNRHRLEVYVLDPRLRLAAAFVRLDWRVDAVLARAVEVTDEHAPVEDAVPVGPRWRPVVGGAGWGGILATAAGLVAAFFPKCPVCWAAYLSVLGVAGVERIPYTPWLLPLLLVGLAVNVGSIWLRERTGSKAGTVLAAAGALAIAASRVGGWESAGPYGVALTLIGSLIAAAHPLRGTVRAFTPADQRNGLRLST